MERAISIDDASSLPPAGSSAVIEDDHARIEFQEAVWDRRYFGRPVVRINQIAGGSDLERTGAVARVLDLCRANDVALVSCRLGTDRIGESMLLEQHGFRHIEVVLHPQLQLDQRPTPGAASTCDSRLAGEQDLAGLDRIAGAAFVHERFFVDPRIDPAISAARYAGWMRSALTHTSQRLHVVLTGGQVVGFFVTESQAEGVCYWHLNAIAPEWHGRGIGKAAWQRMIQVAEAEGSSVVRTCIAARNVKAMNLYAVLGFRFTDPSMTLHWMP